MFWLLLSPTYSLNILGDDTIALLSNHNTNLCDQTILNDLRGAACSQFKDDYSGCKISECEVFGFVSTTSASSTATTQAYFKNTRIDFMDNKISVWLL